MKIIITPSELMDKGLWEKYCDLTNTNIWAVNEGLMNGAEELTLTYEKANELGLLDK